MSKEPGGDSEEIKKSPEEYSAELVPGAIIVSKSGTKRKILSRNGDTMRVETVRTSGMRMEEVIKVSDLNFNALDRIEKSPADVVVEEKDDVEEMTELRERADLIDQLKLKVGDIIVLPGGVKKEIIDIGDDGRVMFTDTGINGVKSFNSMMRSDMKIRFCDGIKDVIRASGDKK